MVDIDHFKAVNDGHGHPAGDEVLQQVAAELQRRIRAEDILSRYGGEEFALLARGIAHEGARALGERLRKGVEALVVPFSAATRLRVTVSVGAATAVGSQNLTAAALVAEADRLLYEAKAAGRNRTCAGTLT
jgi:diguanylate cyclase (GGDEF)-like protein